MDSSDAVLGFVHQWVSEFAKQFERISVICLERGINNPPSNVKVYSLGKESGRSRRFGIEPELTARVRRFRVYEVGISYHGRTYEEGKKIGWKDGISAFWHILRFNLFN